MRKKSHSRPANSFHQQGASIDHEGSPCATHPDTFPAVREDDMKGYGRYRTRDLIVACMNALEAGDTQTKAAV